MDLQEADNFGNSVIYGVDNDRFISILNMGNVQQKGWAEILQKSKLSAKNKDILLKIHANSNPALLLLKYKEF